MLWRYVTNLKWIAYFAWPNLTKQSAREEQILWSILFQIILLRYAKEVEIQKLEYCWLHHIFSWPLKLIMKSLNISFYDIYFNIPS